MQHGDVDKNFAAWPCNLDFHSDIFHKLYDNNVWIEHKEYFFL